jgi:hypothetical protein
VLTATALPGTPLSQRRIAFTALSLSIGWGIRGNFGHEAGAMIAGVLSAIAVVLASGREDWWRRIAYFAFFGALGWSFGGSISYMQVIAYTHSGHSPSVAYGFACLFVIGFLWAALGGAGTALPAVLSRKSLAEFFAPLTAIFGAWWIQLFVERYLDTHSSDYRHEDPLYWFDTDWLGVLVALGAVLLLAAARRRLDRASCLILHMGIGWWAGFLIMVVGLGWRMTPPRGDNWAGCVGMVVGLFVYLLRYRLHAVALAALVSGLVGGFGFATATMLKLVEVSSGLETNWHSVLEQTYGLINGVGIAVVLGLLATRVPRTPDEPSTRRGSELFALVFSLLGVTYLNLRNNPDKWVELKAMPALLYGLHPGMWFNLAYLALTAAFLYLVARHRKQPLPIVPSHWLGRGQMLYLAFLWWMVVGNFERVLPAVGPERLITEGVIFLNAVICSALVLTVPPTHVDEAPNLAAKDLSRWLRRTAVVGVGAFLLTTGINWGVVRAIYGDRFAGHAKLHIRFGPNATVSEQPEPGQPHP